MFTTHKVTEATTREENTGLGNECCATYSSDTAITLINASSFDVGELVYAQWTTCWETWDEPGGVSTIVGEAFLGRWVIVSITYASVTG